MKHKLKNKGGEYGELSEWSTRKKYVYVFLDFRVVIIKKGEIVEASFMMMNQVDSRCFDDNKRWWQKAQENDFKIESTIQESREVWFQDSRKDEFKFQEKKSRRLHKGSIEKIFQKTTKHNFVFQKSFSQNFLSY